MNNANNANRSITVGEMREMLENAPQDAVVRFIVGTIWFCVNHGMTSPTIAWISGCQIDAALPSTGVRSPFMGAGATMRGRFSGQTRAEGLGVEAGVLCGHGRAAGRGHSGDAPMTGTDPIIIGYFPVAPPAMSRRVVAYGMLLSAPLWALIGATAWWIWRLL